MAIFLLSLFGSASIGIYSLATDKIAIIPPQAPETKANKVEKWLGVKVAKTIIGGSVVVGALACANSNGVVLPYYVREEELEIIKAVSDDANLTVMETKRNAYGTMVLTNDYGAIVDPRLKPKTIEKISDTLGVEVVLGEIAGLPYVGSLALATNKGVLAHPLIKEEEQQLLKEVLKVPVDVGTINCGIPYVSTGLIGNSGNVVAGFFTTGPEMFIMGQALDVVK
ncbi:MAG: translation initiation factor IF-6 [Candidatus Bathyarchaeota archaeon]|nr:translation initiation factor IF-6 [Candidatus Bathyarchaeota archaeon]MDH5495656.1 translation initiation factor IF-6 [Candidatus Bathyarchaeota archaeon]